MSSHFFCGHDRLVEVNDHRNTFTCCTCRTAIVGKRFSCLCCGFNLHPFCKTCPEPLLSPTLHPHHPLTRKSTPPAGSRRWCNVCQDPIEGAFYSCPVDPRCDFDAHPVCTQLPPRVRHVLDPRHWLELQHQPHGVRYCDVCREECGGWAYRCGLCSPPIDVHFQCLLKPVADAAPGASRTIIPPGQGRPYGFGGVPEPFYFGLPNYAYTGYAIPANYSNPTVTGTGAANPGIPTLTSFMGSLSINLLVNLLSYLFQSGFQN